MLSSKAVSRKPLPQVTHTIEEAPIIHHFLADPLQWSARELLQRTLDAEKKLSIGLRDRRMYCFDSTINRLGE
jgi:hypothetical protein